MLRGKLKLAAIVTATVIAALLIAVCAVEIRLKPLIAEGAKSRAASAATEIINSAVSKAVAKMPSPVKVTKDANGFCGVEVDAAALAAVRTEATAQLTAAMNDTDTMNFSVPLGNITGMRLLSGRGRSVNVRLVPIGDVVTDIRTEFLSVGINQTLHKIFMKVTVSLNVFAAGDIHSLELTSSVTLAETVIIGEVPDAYTAINRWEIDEEEENDLNDYAATLP